jgi:hypothetical protein
MELLPAIRTAKKNARHLAVSKADSNAVANKEAKEENRHLMLQGQLRYLSDWNAMIFLCNPLLVPIYSNNNIHTGKKSLYYFQLTI